MKAYPRRAPNTNNMQTIVQAEIAVNPSTFGDARVMLLKILIKTRKRVTSKVILAGITSGGIMKLAYCKK